MKTKVVLLFCLVFLAFASLTSAEIYNNSQYNITLEIPPGWEISNNIDDFSKVHIRAKTTNMDPDTTYEQARILIDKYIQFYNQERIQLKTGLTPLEKRNQAC